LAGAHEENPLRKALSLHVCTVLRSPLRISVEGAMLGSKVYCADRKASLQVGYLTVLGAPLGPVEAAAIQI